MGLFELMNQIVEETIATKKRRAVFIESLSELIRKKSKEPKQKGHRAPTTMIHLPASPNSLNGFQSRCDLISQGLQEFSPLFRGCSSGKTNCSIFGIWFHPDGFKERAVR